ncbi:MAG TPA: alpha/beta hydrolase [Phycisphaerae bacterium]|nr:alpha/beta hydrolase [Phycisphaerae bacterium]
MPPFGLFLVATLAGCGANAPDEILLKSGPEDDRSPATARLPYEQVSFLTAGGKHLVGWFVPATSGHGRATVLIHTGMQGNLCDYMPTIPGLVERDLDVFIYDWQGFGTSEGDRRFVNFEPDTYAAVDYLLSRPEPAAQTIIHLGVSLGSAAALGAAAYSPTKTIGVIVYGAFEPGELPMDFLVMLQSPFAAPVGAIADSLFAQWATPFLSPSTHLDGIKAPVLAVIPQDDNIVPPASQLRLYDRYPDPKAIVYTFGGHVGAQDTDPDLTAKMVTWIDSLSSLPPATN